MASKDGRIQEDLLHEVMGVKKNFYPLDLSVHNQKLRDLFYISGKMYWDPREDIPWSQFDPSRYSKEQLEAGRIFWSHRTWIEYQGCFTTASELLGYMLDGQRDFDHKLYRSIQTLEEARHCEVSFLFAEKLGGHIQSPPSEGFGQRLDYQLANRTIEGRVLPECDVIHHWSGEMVAVELFKGRYASATDPVAKTICKLILQDEVRHIQSAALYLGARLPKLSEKERKVVEEALIWQIEKVELGGFHSIARIPSDQLGNEREAFAIAGKAGLGGESPEQQDEALLRALSQIRKTVASWGLLLPAFPQFERAHDLSL